MICPKNNCELPDDAHWEKTSRGKNWIIMPNGNWHDCETDNPKIRNEVSGSKGYVCHECNGRCIHCDLAECQLCKWSNSFCLGCLAHVSVFDAI